MFVCDYILSQKKDAITGSVQDVILNLTNNGQFDLANLEAAWYIGCLDGAPHSRIVLIDADGQEFAFPLRMSSQAEHDGLHTFFMNARSVKLCEVHNHAQDVDVDDLLDLPMLGYQSEKSMILSSMGQA